jgi:hypothetical protein
MKEEGLLTLSEESIGHETVTAISRLGESPMRSPRS